MRQAYRLKRSDFLVPVGAEVLLDVVRGQAAGEGAQVRVRILRHPVVCTIPGLEIQDGGPVIGEVFGKVACGAGRLRSDITFHSRVEGIAAHNLVDVAAGNHSRLDHRV